MQDPQEPFIMNYIVLIGDSSFSNFQKVPHVHTRETETHSCPDLGPERHTRSGPKQPLGSFLDNDKHERRTTANFVPLFSRHGS
jgi:hypothetical protein